MGHLVAVDGGSGGIPPAPATSAAVPPPGVATSIKIEPTSRALAAWSNSSVDVPPLTVLPGDTCVTDGQD